MNKLLIMSSEPWLRLLYAEELMEEGFLVVTAENALAPDLIAQEAPDLVVVDPGSGDGEKILKMIRERHAELPLLLALDQAPLKPDPEKERYVDYFSKSSGPEGLKIKIKSLLRPQKRAGMGPGIHYALDTRTAQLSLDFAIR
jgi:DNA-binding response OmpR family regulator